MMKHADTTSADIQGHNHAIVLFDGVCNFCHAAVNFIIDRDPKGHFRFASLQSAVGEALLREHGLHGLRLTSLVLIDGERAFLRSSAALQIAKRLRAPWPAAYALAFLPRGLRDLAYSAFAARRYTWFGRTESCRIPTPEIRSRFLDQRP